MTIGPLDLVGGAGVALIIGAYLALQLERIDPKGAPFSLYNALGSALVIVSLTAEFNLSAFLVEAFWLAVSLLGLVRAARRGAPSAP